MPRKRDENGLTPKQAQFVSEYMKDFNASAAAKRMGIRATAGAQYLLREPVKKRIEELKAQIDRRAVMDAQEVAEFLTRVARGEVTEPVFKGNGAGFQTEVQQRPKIKDRIRAAELLGKHFGMFVDQVELGGNLPIVIVDDLGK